MSFLLLLLIFGIQPIVSFVMLVIALGIEGFQKLSQYVKGDNSFSVALRGFLPN